MMRHLFLTSAAVAPSRWKESFPAASLVQDKGNAHLPPADVVWVHLLGSVGLVEAHLRQLAHRLPGVRIVAMSDEPSEEEGLVALSAGASGYCNAHADPEVLHQVAEVVARGGLWVGQALLDRFIFTLGSRMLPNGQAGCAPQLDNLTEREREVAMRVSRGEANKEIAYDLDLSERTVKAHLTTAFEKLGVRDRLQLALLLNRRA